MWTCNTKFHRNPIRIIVGIKLPDGQQNDTSSLSICFMKGVQNSYRSIPFKFTAEMVDRWHSCQTPATGFWLVVIEILSVFTLWGGPQVSCSPIPISENTAWFKKMYSISSSGFFLKLVKIQKTLFSNRTELHPIGTGCSTFSEWISTATMDRSRRERKSGALVLAPEISWSHTLRLFLVGGS